MRILLAVSGGIDSMYLANKASEFYPGASFAVAHCNFGLRGDESDGDEKFVRTWADTHGITCFVTRFDTEAVAAERGISVEMAARDLRYAWFAELCGNEAFDAVAVAHNANDNSETLVLNLLRGTGTRGIRGMSEDRVSFFPAGTDRPLRILRPMLGVGRAQIRQWMTAHGMEWREDSTNGESVVKRNIIRNEVFPIFERINPGFVQTLDADMKRFAQVDDIAEDYFCSVKGQVSDGDGINVDALLALRHWEYVLYRFVEHCSLSQETLGKLVALLTRFKNEARGTVTVGGKVFESPTHTLSIHKGKIRIIKKI